ncbi:hypothetical protein AALO_G00161400 [Alosa alosa]|uniref:THD domain-containing protein n=1 Tax=Alosa alosa TaxID=278164 RepID=A0AAV6GFA4_9TELE|nr:lymphotoxin-alpha [Alosa alosa]KAG5272077.1 hypothetical protein AALO_G00161400 [Alosa alosa]
MLSDVSTEVISTDSVTDLRQEEMVITLLRHYQTMRRQETRLRLATGFMILMGLAAVFFFHYQKRNSASEAGIAAQNEPSAQAQHDARQKKKPSFYLTPDKNQTKNMKPMQWLNHTTTQAVQSIWIPTNGIYFVFLQMSHRIPDTDFCAKMAKKGTYLTASVVRTREAYPEPDTLFISKDSIPCTYPNFRSVYAGHLINLMANDKLEVMVDTSSELIDWFIKKGVVFGGYLINRLKD